MQIICDDLDFARFLYGPHISLRPYSAKDTLLISSALRDKVFAGHTLYVGSDPNLPFWSCLCAVASAEHSQLELLAKHIGQNKHDIPDRIIITAREGTGFVGYKNRSWIAVKGNLHITVLVRPFSKLSFVNSGFTVLTSVAMIKTLSHYIPGTYKYGIRWVNDIVVDSKKIGGVLCRTQMQGETVETAIIGLGLNVLTKPNVPTDMFVPDVTHLAAYCDVSSEVIFRQLLTYMAEGYNQYLQGNYKQLWQQYIAHSLVIGQRVAVHSDPYNGLPQHLLSGVVESIGKNLELFLKDSSEPVYQGRLANNE
jgi:biotin-[acetyl-CoA-carboxylase] ligase BirA-like protein